MLKFELMYLPEMLVDMVYPVKQQNYNRISLDALLCILKEGLQSVLRIGSAHNKGGPPSINIVQISHFSNSF